jgi:uncharacterized protein (DUF362 family)
MKAFVAVAHGRAKESTIRALKALNLKVVGPKIVLKPNLASLVRDRGENTDVSVVEGVIEYLQSKGEITIAEGCCGASSSGLCSTYELFEFAGYTRLEDKYGVRLLDLNTDAFERVKILGVELGVAKTALSADYLVTVPVLKTHVFTTISACVKNMMGCLEPEPSPGHETATKWKIHHELSECDSSDFTECLFALRTFERRLIELYSRLAPKLGVIDAIVASEGDAPIDGTPVRLDTVLASENSVSCDAMAAYLIGVDPNTVGFLRIAKKRRLGEIDPAHMEANMDLDPYMRKLRLPSNMSGS